MTIESKEPKKQGVLACLRSVIRLKHFSRSTEKTYIYWARYFLVFKKDVRPLNIVPKDVVEFLSFLATTKNVSASTQNQALCAIVFLLKEVLKIDPGDLSATLWSKRPKFLPVVLSVIEVKEILNHLKGIQWLIGCLLYGTGVIFQCVE